ncbi:hypothetical protein [Mycobacterium lepromatosis]|uniref:hypothetical protein n=1 Tax=Mycobacterium lepromatosis TaxID=480418 RepID=UPI000B0010D3|nr:hypothetical protein [Mycobacterium lepromatosis]
MLTSLALYRPAEAEEGALATAAARRDYSKTPFFMWLSRLTTVIAAEVSCSVSPMT